MEGRLHAGFDAGLDLLLDVDLGLDLVLLDLLLAAIGVRRLLTLTLTFSGGRVPRPVPRVLQVLGDEADDLLRLDRIPQDPKILTYI